MSLSVFTGPVHSNGGSPDLYLLVGDFTVIMRTVNGYSIEKHGFMDIERMTQVNHPLYKRAMNLYEISFPFHEQREALSQSQILCQSTYHFDVVSDDNKFIGEVLYWEIGDFLYIEHFVFFLL